jgi:hypothetical protein
MTFKLDEALTKLRADYNWRSPHGKAQRSLVIERQLARLILMKFEPDRADPNDKEFNDG